MIIVLSVTLKNLLPLTGSPEPFNILNVLLGIPFSVIRVKNGFTLLDSKKMFWTTKFFDMTFMFFKTECRGLE